MEDNAKGKLMAARWAVQCASDAWLRSLRNALSLNQSFLPASTNTVGIATTRICRKSVCAANVCLPKTRFYSDVFFLWAIKDQSQGGGTCLWHRKNDNQLRIHIKCARNICFRIPPKISFLTYTAAGVVRRCEGRSSPHSCLGGGAFVKRFFFACRFQAHVKIVRFDRHLGRQIILVMMTFAILHFSNLYWETYRFYMPTCQTVLNNPCGT